MFGPAFLVAPVYEYGSRTREMYFPECKGWYDFYTNEFVDGGVVRTVDAPYDRIPLYVRAGSIVPFGPEMQWSDEKQADEITLYVYEGADGKFTLYEDENVNYNYEKGAYAMIDFTYSDADKTLTIGKRRGEFPGMLEERKFNVAPVSKNDGFDQKRITVVTYTGEEVKIKL